MSEGLLGLKKQASIGEAIGLLLLLSLALASVIVVGNIPTNEESIGNFHERALSLYALGFVAYIGFLVYREEKKIENTPTSKIRSLAMGPVEIKGTAEQGPEDVILKSPFSGKDCLFYKYKIKEYKGKGRTRRISYN